jgi:hypothetical protein
MTEQHKATPEQWANITAGASHRYLYSSCILELRARIEALEATMPMVLQPLTEVREFIPAPVTHDLTNAAPLLWVLWNHLGSGSPVGQPIRQYLGMGQFERMTEDQIQAAKQYRDCLAMPTTPAPASSLVERVGQVISDVVPDEDGFDLEARAAIREVAAWLRTEDDGLLGMGCDFARLLEQEATR